MGFLRGHPDNVGDLDVRRYVLHVNTVWQGGGTAAEYSNRRDHSRPPPTPEGCPISPIDLSDRPARSSHRDGHRFGKPPAVVKNRPGDATLVAGGRAWPSLALKARSGTARPRCGLRTNRGSPSHVPCPQALDLRRCRRTASSSGG